MYTSVLEQENVLNIEYMQILWKTGMILTIVSTPNENMISEQSRAWRLPNSENPCISRDFSWFSRGLLRDCESSDGPFSSCTVKRLLWTVCWLCSQVEMKLTIKRAGEPHFGKYTCVAKNPRGQTDGSITLYGECGVLCSVRQLYISVHCLHNIIWRRCLL